MSGSELAVLNGHGDLAMDGDLRPYIGTQVEVVKVPKGGLYQVRASDGKMLSVPKRNLDFARQSPGEAPRPMSLCLDSTVNR